MGKQLRVWIWGLGLVLCWGALASVVGQDMMVKRRDPGRSAHNVVCGTPDPTDSSYYYCTLDNYGSVQLVRQLTDFPCVYNRTWGYDRGGVWVQHGCRAEFAAGREGYHDNPEPPARGPAPRDMPRDIPRDMPREKERGRIVTCSSQNNQYVYCAIRIRDDVRLHRQLSSASCRLGRSWGYDAGGIWVDNGCRAEFVVP